MPAVTIRGNGPPRSPRRSVETYDDINRSRIILGFLLLICSIFIIRAFYLQIIRHDHYSKVALNYQLKEYQIPAERGVIRARNVSSTPPLVLNETKYTLFADPIYIKDASSDAKAISQIIGKDASEIEQLLKTPKTRYVVLSKKLSRDQHEAISKLDIKGVGTREETYRTYPQGELASQVLGFVNDDGKGQYGVEEFMNDTLSGKAGELKAITDAKGVPLVSNPDNVIKEPEAGRAVTLSIDMGVQKRVEEILKSGLDRAKSQKGSLMVMDPNTGKVVAMASWPTYNPDNISGVNDISALNNNNTSGAIEVGSIMKVLTTSTALDQGVVSANTAFYDAGFVEVGDSKITDTHNSEGTQTVESLLVESLNTGAVWLLRQIGKGGINERARFTWYNYMTEKFKLGSVTGIEQAGEASGLIPKPEDKGQGIDVIYANTSFGQGMMATPVQMGAAFSSVLNGGKYYKPSIIDSIRDEKGNDIKHDPVVVSEKIVGNSVTQDIINLTQKVATKNIPGIAREGYMIGGKTGTAEIAKPEGGYYKDRFNGTYMGFVGGDRPEYVIVVSAIEPKIPGYAGSQAAAPIFRDTVNMLLDNVGVNPKSH